MPPLSAATRADLEASGLSERTVKAAGISDQDSDPATNLLLRDKHHVLGFLLPYYGVAAKPLRHYRVKVLQSLNGAEPPKYIQPKGTSNHLYIPPTLAALAPDWASDVEVPLLITEGEKKALAAVQSKLACVAVGGVYSWRTHIHTFERERVRVEDKPSARIVHVDDRGEKAYRTEVAPELDEIEWGGRSVTIVFDSDTDDNPEVQRAAFELANWLADRGALARQVSLADRIPAATLRKSGRTKVGLDDLLLLDPTYSDHLRDTEWLDQAGFRPLPQDPLAWVGSQLNDGKANRLTQERVAAFAINWCDANGQRFVGIDNTYYYFDNETRVLHDFRPSTNLASLRETTFGHLLVEQLGLDPVDSATIGRFIGRYPLGAPTITPHRVVAHSGDVLYYQLSDADVVRIDSRGLSLVSNGDDDILFYARGVEPLDPEVALAACEAWIMDPSGPKWYTALATLNIADMPGMSHEETIRLLSCLFYMSPWLQRWRGMMMPLEIAVAEPNSGKTFLYNLRKGVLTGSPALAGLSDDFRSWTAAVGSAPALWVCDNLGNVRSDFWHRLNDELARLITDPEPSIELRQLYTTATTFRVPVNAAFAITTVKNPFTAPDVLQRSLVFNLSAIPVGARDSDWYTERLARRPEWVAEHLNVLHLFLRRSAKEWKSNFGAGYRLAHFEQGLLIMGRVLGWNMQPVVDKLADVVAQTVAAYDPVIEAFATFVEEYPDNKLKRRLPLRAVCEWVEQDSGERFTALRQFANEITLSKYVMAHKYDIEQSTSLTITKEGSQITIVVPGGHK